MSDCLTDEFLTRFLDGHLTDEELRGMHKRMKECPHCHEFVLGLIHHTGSQEEVQPLLREWTPPAKFDEFCLGRLLGRGAMGVVYLAQDTQLDRPVAVKFIAAHHPGPQALEQFETEAKAIARLRHPNIVTVFNRGWVDDHPYIVTEYLEGQTLGTLTLPLPWRQVLALGVGLARGLEAAHAADILHRDIKPSNAFLTLAGEVKLIDFGLAEFVDPAASTEGLARTLAGTRPYMAPELIQRQKATTRSDLYALGVVLFQLCRGQLPEEHPAALLNKHVPGIDPDFALLIQCCLQAAPNERYGSAKALRTALERLHVPEIRWEGNPYRGLASFEAEHRALFFGRDDDIQKVLERLRRQPLVLIAGDSGIGKSSLCRAGLLPQVTHGALDDALSFTSLTLQPGRSPVANLAAALAPFLHGPEGEPSTWLTEQPGRLGPALEALRKKGRGLLLFVDQLEELITLSEPGQAEHFARILGELGALNVSASGVRVLLAVRGDFLTRVGVLPGLDSAFERALYLLRPLTPEGVREAIVGPARGRRVTFEAAALQTLVEAMARKPGSLPLLQFALSMLWEQRNTVQDCITQASLEDMGGVAGALSHHADDVIAPLSEAGLQAVRQQLGLLITAEDTRGERSEEELLAVSPRDGAAAALRALVDGRLIQVCTEGGRAHYELAHEALITGWAKLRHWLDEDAGRRALRQRLEPASAEWNRLGRPEELLWRKRQLEEARALPATGLGSCEQDFLRASRRAVRRQGALRRMAVFLVLLLLACGYGVPRLWAHGEDQLFVGEKRELARAQLSLGREWSRRATEARERALVLFDAEDTDAEQAQQRWAEAERLWSEALQALQTAGAAHNEARRALEDILAHVGDEPEAHELRLQLAYERFLLAETFHREEESTLLQDFQRLAAGDEAWRKRLDTMAGLEIQTTPPGATVELSRYQKTDGVWQREPVGKPGPLGQTPIAQLSLEAGSYHLRFTREGEPTVDLPILLERGKTERLQLNLPTSVPEGYVYIPPGCTLTGTNDPEPVRDFMRSAPLHKRCVSEGYLMGKYEVTLGEWMEYLGSPKAKQKDRDLLIEEKSSSWGALTLRPDHGSWQFALKLADGKTYLKASKDQDVKYLDRSMRQEQKWTRFPLAGVTSKEVSGYRSWLNDSGKLPGARLCNELEWVRGARGADDRRYPHGSRLEPDDANFDETYGRRPASFGPDEVGMHPAAASPFGIHDLAGNVSEMVTSPGADLGSNVVILGGAWYFERIVAFVPNRQAFTDDSRDVTAGLRLCASWPPQ